MIIQGKGGASSRVCYSLSELFKQAGPNACQVQYFRNGIY